jgi:vancomycin resistance protein YoaR
VKDAAIRLESSQVVVEESQVGIEMDIPATLEQLRTRLFAMEDVVVPVVVQETPPLIEEVETQADLARRILSEPLALIVPDEEQTWTIQPEELAAMLVIQLEENGEPDQPVYQIAINETLLTNYLASLAPGLSVEPVNARFIFNDDTRQLDLLEPAVIGRKLDVDTSVAHIKDEVIAGAHTGRAAISHHTSPL